MALLLGLPFDVLRLPLFDAFSQELCALHTPTEAFLGESVTSDDKTHTIRLNLPGVKAADVRVEATPASGKAPPTLRVTASSERVKRRYMLPAAAAADQASAWCVDGVLTVKVPLAAAEVWDVAVDPRPLGKSEGEEGEEAAAYHLRLAVPGAAAKDVQVSVERAASGGGKNKLRVAARGVLRECYVLPAEADAASAQAACADGLLTVRIPKVAPAPVEVGVSLEGFAESEREGAGGEAAVGPASDAAARECFRARVVAPGAAAKDVRVLLTPDRRNVHVAVMAGTQRGVRALVALPAAARAEAVIAAAVDGIVHVGVPADGFDSPPAPTVVAVADAAPVVGDGCAMDAE